MHDVLPMIRQTRLVAILRGVPRDRAESLLEGGVKIFEVTCNTPGALTSIELLAKRFDRDACLGADTVMDPETVSRAADAGAFHSLARLQRCRNTGGQRQGACLRARGYDRQGSGCRKQGRGEHRQNISRRSLGPGYIKNLLGPLDSMQFMVVGGVDLNNLCAFFDARVGGCLVQKSLVAVGDWKGLRELARVLPPKPHPEPLARVY